MTTINDISTSESSILALKWSLWATNDFQHDGWLRDKMPNASQAQAFGDAMVETAKANNWPIERLTDITSREWYRAYFTLTGLYKLPERAGIEADEDAAFYIRVFVVAENAWFAREFVMAGLFSLDQYREVYREYLPEIRALNCPELAGL